VRATLAAAALVFVLVAVACSPGPDPYAPLHQQTREPIPGTFGVELVPVDDVAPVVGPTTAYEALQGDEVQRDVAVTLARVFDPSSGTTYGPAWVYLTHDLCFFTAKGDFVSPSRAGLDDGCTDDNVLVQVVDASTGSSLATYSAYFEPGGFVPDRLGSADQVPDATRFH